MKPPPPIQALPQEIIGAIILHALGYYSPRSNPEQVNLDTRGGPWVYSQVCRLWRQETSSLQSIWTNIRLDDNVADVVGYPAAVSLLDILLSRSKQPLDISIRFRRYKYTDQMLALLAAQSSRWRNIKLSGRSSTVQLSRMVRNLPCLESLDFEDFGGMLGFDVDDVDQKFLSNAPKLRRVSFTHVNSIAKLRLPWSQLTHFHALVLFEDTEIEILNSMPNLVWFEINSLVRIDSNPDGAEITPANLRHIGLDRGSISRLRLPKSLTALHLMDFFRCDDMRYLVQRSGCSIQTLILGERLLTVESDSADLVLLCTELTSVTTLELQDDAVLSDLLATNDPLMLPNLITIKLCTHKLTFFIQPDPSPHIIEFLKARIPRGCKELCFSGNLQGHTERELFDLEMRYRQELGELETKLVIRFEETDSWGELVGRYCSIPVGRHRAY